MKGGVGECSQTDALPDSAKGRADIGQESCQRFAQRKTFTGLPNVDLNFVLTCLDDRGDVKLKRRPHPAMRPNKLIVEAKGGIEADGVTFEEDARADKS